MYILTFRHLNLELDERVNNYYSHYATPVLKRDTYLDRPRESIGNKKTIRMFFPFDSSFIFLFFAKN